MKRDKLIRYRGDRTQADMAAIYGVSQQAWNSWELGLTKPRPYIMKLLELDSGIPMETLFFDAFNKEILLESKEA